MRQTIGMQAMPEPGTEAFLRVGGRNLILYFSGAMRSIRMYPVENAVVQTSLAQLVDLVSQLTAAEGDLEVRASGEFLFINGTRLRLDLDNYANFNVLVSAFRANGIGSVTVHGATTPRDWTVLLSFLAQSGPDPDQRLEELTDRLAQAGIEAFSLEPASETEDSPDKAEAKEAAKRTYAQGVAATRDVINSVRMGQSPNLKKIKRVV